MQGVSSTAKQSLYSHCMILVTAFIKQHYQKRNCQPFRSQPVHLAVPCFMTRNPCLRRYLYPPIGACQPRGLRTTTACQPAVRTTMLLVLCCSELAGPHTMSMRPFPLNYCEMVTLNFAVADLLTYILLNVCRKPYQRDLLTYIPASADPYRRRWLEHCRATMP